MKAFYLTWAFTEGCFLAEAVHKQTIGPFLAATFFAWYALNSFFKEDSK